jgi:hypothetical protein
MTRLLTSLALSLLLTLTTSLTLHAGDHGDSTDIADTARTDDERSLSPAKALKEATFVMMEDLIEISVDIGSVGDVRKARPHIAKAMNKIVLLTENMIANAATLTSEDQAELQNMQTDMQNDPRFKKLNKRATKVQEDLTERSPGAAAEFQKVTQEEGMKMAQAMMTAMQKMTSQSMEWDADEEDVDATPPGRAESSEVPRRDVETYDEETYDDEGSGSDRQVTPAIRLKEATLDMMEDLIEIAEEIESVEDVREARPAIVAAMNKIVVMTEEMVVDAASLTPEDQAELQNMQTDMQNDPRFKKLNKRATKVQEDLTERSPGAAAEFQKVTQEEGMKMAQAMMTAMQKLMSR